MINNKSLSKLMNKREQKDLVCRWLESQGINDFAVNMMTDDHTRIDIYLPTQNIAIHFSDGHNQAFYERVKEDFRPFFVRKKDTMEFVFEKLTNCINGHTCHSAHIKKQHCHVIHVHEP